MSPVLCQRKSLRAGFLDGFSALEFLLLILNIPEKYTGLEMCEDDNVRWPTHIPKDRTNVRLSRDGGHQVTKMNLNEIWQFMEDARVNHWSLVELAKVRERENSAGAKPGAVHLWARKGLAMYYSRTKLAFQGCHRWAFATDGSTHGCKDLDVTVAFSHLNSVAAFAPCQHKSPSKIICPGEFHLDHEVETLAASRNVERLKSYKFISGISHQLWRLSSGTLSIADLKAFPEMIQEPLGSQRRRLQDGRVMVKHHDEDNWRQQDLTLASEIPVLSLMMDQGPTNTAAIAWLYDQGFLIHAQFDKYHRLARDLTNSKNARLTQSQMKSSYIFGVNYKPFGQGSFFDEKRSILSSFMASCSAEPHSYLLLIYLLQEHVNYELFYFLFFTCSGPLCCDPFFQNLNQAKDSRMFQKYVDRIAFGYNVPCNTMSDQAAIFDALPVICKSFVQKLSFPKQSRWLAWNECAEQYLPEFYAARMLLEWYLDSANGRKDPDEDPLGSLREGAQSMGGLRLAYACMSQQTFEDVSILRHCMKPAWSWFTHQVENIKTPKDNVEYIRHMVDSWKSESHLKQIGALLAFGNQEVFGKLACYSMDADLMANNIFKFVSTFLHERCSSFLRHACPPDTWIGLLSDDLIVVDQAIETAKQNYYNLLACERSWAPCSQELASDLRLWFTLPCRLICSLLEESGWSRAGAEMFNEAVSVMRTLYESFPDSKIIEDVHKILREVRNKQSNRKMKAANAQFHCQGSSVIQQRDMNHSAAIGRQDFLSKFKTASTRDFAPKSAFKSSAHKLPPEFGRIMSKKMWSTLSQDTLDHSSAGWAWLTAYIQGGLKGLGISIQAGSFTKSALLTTRS